MLTTMAHVPKAAATCFRRPAGRGPVSPSGTGHGYRRYGIAALALVMVTGFCITLKAPAASALADGRISMIHTYDDQYCLAADPANSVPGGRVILLPCDGNDHYQQWAVTDVTPADWDRNGLRGFYVLRNVRSGLCLSGGIDLASVSQDACSSSNETQVWMDWPTPIPGISYFTMMGSPYCLQYHVSGAGTAPGNASSAQPGSPVYQQLCSDTNAPAGSYPAQYWVEYTW